MGGAREKAVLFDWDSALGNQINSGMEQKEVAGRDQVISRF